MCTRKDGLLLSTVVGGVVGRGLLALLVCAGLLFPLQPAQADEPDASDAPRTSGPLVGWPFGCEDNGPAGPRQAKGQGCAWHYSFAPAETNAGEDFSALWIQMEIDPGRSWCAKELGFDISVPDNARIVSATPHRSAPIRKTRLTPMELVVDGEQTAPVPGMIAQDVRPGRGRVTINVTEHRYKYRWTATGHSPEKIVVAIGVQIAHRTLASDLFGVWSSGMSFAIGSCRPHSMRSGPR